MDMSTRYTEMQDKGLKVLSAGSVQPFNRYDDSLREKLLIASEWSVPSGDIQSIIKSLQQCMSIGDLGFIYAGSHYPLHATLKQATGFSKKNNRVSFPNLRSLTSDLPGAKFDTLILDGGKLILAARHVPEELVKIREKLDQELLVSGLTPSPLPILHITLARIAQLPAIATVRQKALDGYVEQMLVWRTYLEVHPVSLELSSNVSMDTTYDLLTRGDCWNPL